MESISAQIASARIMIFARALTSPALGDQRRPRPLRDSLPKLNVLPHLYDGFAEEMAAVRGLFWDIGGVLLTNAWDHEERDLAIQHFNLEKQSFESRHTEVVSTFEEGRVSLNEYLERTVFYQQRPFSTAEFKQFMFELSKPKSEVLEIARKLSDSYPMGIINNESRELNEFRIRKFELRNYFKVFVSSCSVGIRKPDERIYRLALDLTQQSADECCFIDDRQVNIETAARVGMRTVLMQNPDQLKKDFRELGIQL
jgi:putative hydrolase of the HAD superfamily